MKMLTGLVTAVGLAMMTMACGQSDAGITTSIKTKFAQDDVVKAHDIDVTTVRRVVTLTGNVDSVAARDQAIHVARTTEGVRDVIDDLQVVAVGTAGERDGDAEVEIDLDGAGRAIREGAEITGEALRDTGKAVGSAVTDDDRDSDRDGR